MRDLDRAVRLYNDGVVSEEQLRSGAETDEEKAAVEAAISAKKAGAGTDTPAPAPAPVVEQEPVSALQYGSGTVDLNISPDELRRRQQEEGDAAPRPIDVLLERLQRGKQMTGQDSFRSQY